MRHKHRHNYSPRSRVLRRPKWRQNSPLPRCSGTTECNDSEGKNLCLIVDFLLILYKISDSLQGPQNHWFLLHRMPRTGCSFIINIFLQIIQNRSGGGGEGGRRNGEGVGRMRERTGSEKTAEERKKQKTKKLGFSSLKFIVIVTIFW